MFESVKEKNTPIGKFFWAILVGIGYSAVTFLGLCTCVMCGQCAGVNCADSSTFNAITVAMLVLPIIIGLIVGAVYASACSAEIKRKQREGNEEMDRLLSEKQRKEELEQRQKYASEFKNNAKKITYQCVSIKEKGEAIVLAPEDVYSSSGLQREAWKEINEISLSIQKIENTAAELNAREGK